MDIAKLWRRSPRADTGECKLASVHGGRLKPIVAERFPCNTARGLGRRGALQALAGQTMQQKTLWLEEARISAILGSCMLSMKSVRSGVRCYIAFVGKLLRSPCALNLFCLHSCQII